MSPDYDHATRERVAKLEVNVKNLQEDLKEVKGDVTEDLRLIQADLGGIKQGQAGLETTMGQLSMSFENQISQSAQQSKNRWKWLMYLIFPVVVAVTVKFLDFFLGGV
jgi:hypothetical protein